MPSVSLNSPYVCARCLQRQFNLRGDVQNRYHGRRSLHKRSISSSMHDASSTQDPTTPESKGYVREVEEERGAMSRRLEDMTEKSIAEGGRSAQKAVADAGFSKELREKLEARILDSKFKSENAAAFSLSDMPVRLLYHTACHRS